MPPIVAEILQFRKTKDVLLVVSMVLVALCAFGFGRLSVQPTAGVPVALCARLGGQQESVASVQGTQTGASREVQNQVAQAVVASGTYVASKNSSVYHLPWCSGAKRIKEENKIWFTSKAEAERAGYVPAANCDGL